MSSAGAGLPSLGEVAIIITLITLIFFALLAVCFAISAMMGSVATETEEEEPVLAEGEGP